MYVVCSAQKNFYLIVSSAIHEKTGSEIGKIQTKFARLHIKHGTNSVEIAEVLSHTFLAKFS